MFRWRWLSRCFPGWKESEEDTDTSDSESRSSEETDYFDSVDDDRDADEKLTFLSPESSFSLYPPLSSVERTEAAAGGGFIDLKSDDDFDQNCTPLSCITEQSPAGKAKESPMYRNDVEMDLSSILDRCTPETERATVSKVELIQHPFYSSWDWRDVNGETSPCTPDAEQAIASGMVHNVWRPMPSLENGLELKGNRALTFSECRFDAEQSTTTSHTPHSEFRLCGSLHRDSQLQSSTDTPWTGSPRKRRRQECYSAPSAPIDRTQRTASQDSCRGFGIYFDISDRPLLDEEILLMGESHCQDSDPFESAPQQTFNATSADISRQLRDASMFPALSEQAKALGKLDFCTQVFPLLTGLDGRYLEDLYEVADKRLDDGQRFCFVNGKMTPSTNYLPPEDYPDPGLFFYDCHVDSHGFRFKMTENRQGTTILHRTLGPDKVLRVFFTSNSQVDHALYRCIAKTGIVVGCRLYKYFIHVPSDKPKRNKGNEEGRTKCYFVCVDSIGERDRNDETFRTFRTIEEARTLFMHIHTCPDVSNYIARLRLVFSKTMTVNMPYDLEIHLVEDLVSKDPAASEALFTDGTGYMSSDLAKLMPSNVFKGKVSSTGQRTGEAEGIPCLIQFRLFDHGAAYKGTLLRNDKLPPKTIILRASMLKVKCDSNLRSQSIRSFELVSTSRFPRPARLSRDLISLLSIGGVPSHIFLDAIKHEIDETQAILHDRKLAHEALVDWESTMADVTLSMLRSGVPLEEPGLHKNLTEFTKSSIRDFSEGKVSLFETFYLMGTADPSGTLEPNQVVIYRGKDLVCGTVLVYRAPGKHPGDVHKVDAVHNRALADIVKYPRNLIFFSTKGYRPLPHAIAGGDLDGDLYWICHNKEVVESFTEYSTRWYRGAVKIAPQNGVRIFSKDVSSDELEKALFNEFIRDKFFNSSVVGQAATRWRDHVEAYLHPDTPHGEKKIHEQEFLKYVDYVYQGVDKKSGLQLILPVAHDILDRRPERGIPSNMVPGAVDNLRNGRSVFEEIKEYGQAALSNWDSIVYEPVDFNPKEVLIVPNSTKHIPRWQGYFRSYRKEMSAALGFKGAENYHSSQLDHISLKYKELLFEDMSLTGGKDWQSILEEASAIYQIVYENAAADCHNGGTCKPSVAFAWNVAGMALTCIFANHQSRSGPIVWADHAYNEVHQRHKVNPSNASQRFTEDYNNSTSLGDCVSVGDAFSKIDC